MAFTEYVFQIRHSDNLLCRFTKEEHARIVINLLRPDVVGRVDKAIFTLIAERAVYRRFLTGAFAKRYGLFRILSEGPGYCSVEISTEVLNYYRDHNPVDATLRMLGLETIFQPIVVADGAITITVASPNPEGRFIFTQFAKHMRKIAPPDEFRLLHIGEYVPTYLEKIGRARLTPRQEEVARMAIALGYYDEPRRCTLDEIAQAFGASKAAVHKRLQTAENHIMKGLFAVESQAPRAPDEEPRVAAAG